MEEFLRELDELLASWYRDIDTDGNMTAEDCADELQRLLQSQTRG